jgi:hypothetical protein
VRFSEKNTCNICWLFDSRSILIFCVALVYEKFKREMKKIIKKKLLKTVLEAIE